MSDDIGISDRLHARINRQLFPGLLVDEAGQGGFSASGQDQQANRLVSSQSPLSDNDIDQIGISDRLHERLSRQLFPHLLEDKASQGGFSASAQDHQASRLVSSQAPLSDNDIDQIGMSDRLHERLNRQLFPLDLLEDKAGQGGFSTSRQNQKASRLVSSQSPFLDLVLSYHNIATNPDLDTTHQGGSRFGSRSAAPTPSVHNRYAPYRLFGPKRASPPPRRIAGSHFPVPASKCHHSCMIARA